MKNEEYLEIRRFLRRTPEFWENLAPKQSEIARLYFLQQHTMSDIAKERGVNKSTISYSMEGLRKKYRKYIRANEERILDKQRYLTYNRR